MNQHAVVSKFSHVKPGDTDYKGGGLRDFFLYRDLGIADATGGQVICHLVKANPDRPPEEGTGWHRHECDFQIVIMMTGISASSGSFRKAANTDQPSRSGIMTSSVMAVGRNSFASLSPSTPPAAVTTENRSALR